MYPLLPAQPTAPESAPQGYSPHPALPGKEALGYAKMALELLLLLLAVPWILRELVRHPGQVSRKAATKHLAT